MLIINATEASSLSVEAGINKYESELEEIMFSIKKACSNNSNIIVVHDVRCAESLSTILKRLNYTVEYDRGLPEFGVNMYISW